MRRASLGQRPLTSQCNVLAHGAYAWPASCILSEGKRAITMIRTVEAVIDEQGNVQLREPVHLPAARRALVMILEEQPGAGVSESALLSETALAEDWNRPEEDEAWSYLQPVPAPY